jgi:2-polyprenyl-6-hydroxyphenyl methylase/3-demethylubiquinone-9 3-methyltransferase
MASANADLHANEVRQGQRFRFGKNWSDFLGHLTVPRIRLAEKSLKEALNTERLDGLTFLDIGSGSGLFSLTARRLGATVTSFDFDPDSVRCTESLRERYFPGDPNWRVERGSALDADYLRKLGTFDIVYSWGVLHHTGDMWRALALVEPAVKVGGTLFISLYNDQGEATDRWARIKQRYNALPAPLAFAYACAIISREEGREFVRQLRRGSVGDWLRTWTEYDQISTRGMSRWHDWIDWIGGYPYERVRVEPIVDFYARDGFQLVHLVDRSSGYGCNEFVFKRVAEAGVQVESRLPRSASMARRFGRRLSGPLEQLPEGVFAPLNGLEKPAFGSRLFVLKDDQIIGKARVAGPDRVQILEVDKAILETDPRDLVVLEAREQPFPGPYRHARGKMYEVVVSELADLSDNEQDTNGSPVHLFEDGKQLPMPHATHDEIARFGEGRFSHWGTAVLFSSLDGSDPNANGRDYTLLLPPAQLGVHKTAEPGYAIPVVGPFELDGEGWRGKIMTSPPAAEEGTLLLLRDGMLVGPIVPNADGSVIIAAPDASEDVVTAADYSLMAGHFFELKAPFGRARGQMFEIGLPEYASLSDRPGDDRRSPLFMFEDGHPLPKPHAVHDEIDQIGRGRYSHWEGSLYFSSSDGSDPNENGRDYRVLVATRTS